MTCLCSKWKYDVRSRHQQGNSQSVLKKQCKVTHPPVGFTLSRLDSEAETGKQAMSLLSIAGGLKLGCS